MAKRRKMKFRTATTRKVSYFKSKRKSSKSSKFFGLGMETVGAFLYGGIRSKLSNALDPVTNKIPLGSIADEVGMYLALEAGKRFIGNKVPMVKDIAKAGQFIELARIGEAVFTGNLNLTSNNSTATATNNNLNLTIM